MPDFPKFKLAPEEDPAPSVRPAGVPKFQLSDDTPPLDPNEVGSGESFRRGIDQGFTFNNQRRVEGAAAAMWAPQNDPSYDPAPSRLPSYMKLPLAAVGGARLLAENAAPSIFGHGGHDAYQKVWSAEDKRNQLAQQQHPWTYGGGTLAGAALNPVTYAGGAEAGAGLGANVLRGAAAGAGLSAANSAGEGNTLDEALHKGAEGVVPGLAGGALGGALGHFLQPGYKYADVAAHGINPETLVQDGINLNTKVPRFLASDSPSVQGFASTLADLPWGGSPLKKAAAATHQSINDAIKDMSGGVTPFQAGKTLNTGIDQWVNGDAKKMVGDAYTRASKAINPNTTVPLSSTQRVANDLSTRLNAAGLPPSKGINLIQDALSRPHGLTYDGIKTLRTQIGELLDNGMLPPEISKQHLNAIYGGLSRDLDRAASVAGGQQGQILHHNANQMAAAVAAKREALASLTANGDAAPERAFANLIATAGSKGNADIELLQHAKDVLSPNDWDTVAKGVLGTLGRSGNDFSPAAFATDFGKLGSSARDTLLGTAGTTMRDKTQSAVNLSLAMRRANSFANHSNSAPHLARIGLLAGLKNRALDIGTGLVLTRGASNALANPATLNSVRLTNKLLGAAANTARAAGTVGKGALLGLTRNQAKHTNDNTNFGNVAAAGAGWALNKIGDYLPVDGRSGHAKGGRIGPSHEALVNRLFSLSAQAKREQKAATKPLLDIPDEPIVKALALAQGH